MLVSSRLRLDEQLVEQRDSEALQQPIIEDQGILGFQEWSCCSFRRSQVLPGLSIDTEWLEKRVGKEEAGASTQG